MAAVCIGTPTRKSSGWIEIDAREGQGDQRRVMLVDSVPGHQLHSTLFGARFTDLEGAYLDVRPKCTCNGAPDLMFCCSGVADTAEIGDRAVRRFHKQGVARMYCLGGIPAKAEVIVQNGQAASRIVVVDGCDTDCARLTMESGGFTGFRASARYRSRHGKGQDPGHGRTDRGSRRPRAATANSSRMRIRRHPWHPVGLGDSRGGTAPLPY